MHGLLAAGTDISVRELARKTLGQRYVPATVSFGLSALRSASLIEFLASFFFH